MSKFKIEREEGDNKIFKFGYQELEVRISQISDVKTLVFDAHHDVVAEMTLDQLAEIVVWASDGGCSIND